jgi:endonuclease III
MPRSTDAVLILVDRIKHPDDSIERCARRLRKQSATITPEAINALLAQYGIGKKTADFP